MPLKKKSSSNLQLSAPDKGKQNIKVVIRLRPSTKPEDETLVQPILKCVSSREIITKEKKFEFDQVIKPEENQLEVYHTVVAPMIPDVITGYNCTVFAYGQTGSGKTYTMTGDNCQCPSNWKEDPSAGCIPRAAAHIFDELRVDKNEHNVKISYLELYNEEIRDLLSDDESLPAIYNDTKGSVFIQGLTEVSVHDSESLCIQLQKGNFKRQTAATLMNHQSSRSHTVVTITVHSRETTASGEDILKTGKLNLVDLAGSENIAKSGCKDMRAIELANINKSLLTLGRVIHALADKGQKHIPYRDSKLTRILKDSLGGNTKTCIIATISPGANAYDETLSTLEYALRARDIKNTPIINEKLTKAQIIQGLLTEIDKLQKDLDAARDKSGFFIDKENYQKLLDSVESITGQKVTLEELTRRQAIRIEELEEILKARTKEFDDAVDMCKKSKELLAKAKEVIREKKTILKQEQFVAQVYETEASQLHKQAEQLLSTSKLLSAERGILQEKLKKQQVINMKNQTIGQNAVSQILDILQDISNEGEKLELSDKVIFKLCSSSLHSLKNDLQCPLHRFKGHWEAFGELMGGGLSIKEDMRDSVDKYIGIIRERTLDIGPMLSLHLDNLDKFTKENGKNVMKDIKIITRKYTYGVRGLVERIHEILSTEDEAVIERLTQLEQNILRRRRRERHTFQRKAEIDRRILERIAMIRDQLRARNYEGRDQQLFFDLIQETEKTVNQAEATVDNLEEKVSGLLVDPPVESVEQNMLTALNQFEEEANTMSATLHENQEQLRSARESIQTKIKDILDILNTKENTVNSRFEFLMNDRDTFKQLLEIYLRQTQQILNEEVLEKFVPVRHEGDTPSRESSVDVIRSVQPLAPRAALIEKFKEQTALLGDESVLVSDPDLEVPAEPGDSALP